MSSRIFPRNIKLLRSVSYLKMIGYISTFFTEVDKNAPTLCHEACRLRQYFINRRTTNKSKRTGQKASKAAGYFQKRQIPQIAATRASFMVAYNIAKHSNSLCDVCPEHRKEFEEISLSRRTIARRIEAIDEDLK
ncbi:hypothetical protein RF11_02498 [Thelohanellus kitauei]|uniref:Uncharacterized protein n=1 Tax=Thelohanellus kitauei TaxID=669202 RepID=A0A0C2IAK6_THEKT|nr:hypothetical protein RF11_02498 [Thelohanellus kitauei]